MATASKPRPTPKPRQHPAEPEQLLARLRDRLRRERAALARSQQRLLRAFHAWEKQLRLTARLERRLGRLECPDAEAASPAVRRPHRHKKEGSP